MKGQSHFSVGDGLSISSAIVVTVPYASVPAALRLKLQRPIGTTALNRVFLADRNVAFRIRSIAESDRRRRELTITASLEG